MTDMLDVINCAVHLEKEEQDELDPPFIPNEQQFNQWVALVFKKLGITDSELSLLVCTTDTIQDLNARFRQKDKPTNVLSFPSDVEHEKRWLGDIAICAKVVNNEAIEQGKTAMAHWAHMTIHGCLHLLGYDHIDDDEATEMETLETELLALINITDPYLIS